MTALENRRALDCLQYQDRKSGKQDLQMYRPLESIFKHQVYFEKISQKFNKE